MIHSTLTRPTVSSACKARTSLPRQQRDSCHSKRTAPSRLRQRLCRIESKDPEKPCPIARLPAEIWNIIYSCLIPTDTVYLPNSTASKSGRQLKILKNRLWPPLLHVCHTIRREYASFYYTQTPFEWTVLSPAQRTHSEHFIERLSMYHRRFFAQNKNITLIWSVPETRQNFSTPQENWSATRQFGNIYEVPSNHTQHFITFCELARWFLWCEKYGLGDTEWQYEFDPGRSSRYYQGRYLAQLLWHLLAESLEPLARPCTQIARLANEQRKVIGKSRPRKLPLVLYSTIPKQYRSHFSAKGGLRMLTAADLQFQTCDITTDERARWGAKERKLRHYLTRWETGELTATPSSAN
jgi:hypothetical protein